MDIKRIDKIIALNCNITRKEARALIKEGAVTLNGQRVFRAQESVDIENDEITVQGKAFDLKEHIYIMLNKPAGVISATNDPKKETVIDILPPNLKRRSLFPCGRLDRDTTGILIITDDGALSHRLMSPSHHVYKTYIATLEKEIDECDIERLENGIILDDKTKCLPARVKKMNINGSPAAQIMIREGKYHQVKRMFAACGNKVLHLHRSQIGSLPLDPNLKEGEAREMTRQELELLFIEA